MPAAQIYYKAFSKANKGSHDRIKALEVAIFELRSNECDKNWQNVDKCLQVLLKVSELNAVMEHCHVLLGIQWVLTKIDKTAPCGPIMNSVAFLTKVCDQVPSSRAFLRDNLSLTSTLTQLLTSLGASSSTKAGKVLELMRYIVHGISIIRPESFLEKLIFHLLRFINARDGNSSTALGILACLCHNNFIVGKMLLSSMTAEQRKDLYSRSYDDARTKIFLEHLLTSLSRRHFMPVSSSKYDPSNLQMKSLSDAFCAAYSDNDCLTLWLCIDFLKEVTPDMLNKKSLNEADGSNDDTLRKSIMHIIKQLFCMADFADGSAEANSLLFSFARHLAVIHGHSLSLVDVTAKALLIFVEARGGQDLFEAVSMLSDVLQDDLMNDSKKENVTMMSSLRLQIDSLLASFAPLLTLEATKETEVEAMLKCSMKIAQIDDWATLVSAHFTQPSLILTRLNREACNVSACLFELAQVLRLNSKKWEMFFAEELETDETIVRSWVNCFETKCHPEAFSRYFSIIQGHPRTYEVFMKLMASKAEENEEETRIVAKSARLDENAHLNEEVEKMLQRVHNAMENNDVNECLSEVWELNEYKLMAQQTKFEALRESLNAADEQISNQKTLNTQLELENSRLNSVIKHLLHKVDVTQKEIRDVRQQCSSISQEASSYRAETLKDLKCKEEDIQVLEGNQAKLLAKVAKYKEQLEAFQETIKEHQKVQDELHEKLRSEAKTNAELTNALSKREEKLKKREKMLAEESVAKENMEKEMESLKKEITSLQTLNKRLEATLAKKEKQYSEVQEKLSTFKQIQAQIFSLSKTVQHDREDE